MNTAKIAVGLAFSSMAFLALSTAGLLIYAVMKLFN